MSRGLGYPLGEAISLALLGNAVFMQQVLTQAMSLLEESMALCRRHTLSWGGAVAALFLGQCLQARGDYAAAEAAYQDSLERSRAVGDRLLKAFPLNRLGMLARRRGEYAEARRLHEAALALNQAIGSERMTAGTLAYLGGVARDEGDYSAATAYFTAVGLNCVGNCVG